MTTPSTIGREIMPTKLRSEVTRSRQFVYSQLDKHITDWMARHGITLLRISLGVVFLWFGMLKFFPGLSPA